MCDVCCSELKGWCKAFTWTEILLAILEAILLVICIGFVLFLTLHLLACRQDLEDAPRNITVGMEDVPRNVTETTSKTAYQTTQPLNNTAATRATVPPGMQCTWNASHTTETVTQYFLRPERSTSIRKVFENYKQTPVRLPALDDIDTLALEDQSDGEDADSSNSFVLALVKFRPLQTTVGCILTAVSEYWTLTAASCVEAIEELGGFVMVEGYGATGRGRGRSHAVGEVRVHPQYGAGGRGAGPDVAALRSEGRLRAAAALPALLDYLLITIGERFTILGYGGFRTIDKTAADRRLRAVHVYSLPSAQCGAPAGAGGARGARGALCAGVLRARGRACAGAGAGTPLLRAGTLMGVRGARGVWGARGGAAPCEPALYANVAAVGDWLVELFDGK